MTTDFDIYTNSKAWPFVEAKRIYDHIGGKIPAKGFVLFETGYGPSGLPHIGTFGEVTRTTMVMNAFRKICDIPAKLICFSDDIDGLRKVPGNLPNQEMIAKYLNKPLTKVPDPFGEKESFGHYMNAKLRSFLDRFGFEYEFYSATDCYNNGEFDHMMIRVIEKYDEIMALMLPTFRDERRATYSPFMPICPKTGDVLQVPIKSLDLKNGTISYIDPNDGEEMTVPVTGGHCKLQWKPDFGMRWCALNVDYEMYGKDHMPNAPLYSKICNILGGPEPIQFFYELFLDADGAKISKSKGNSISVEEWLHYAPKESLSLFMYQSPSRAKRLFFDVIPKCVDEYLSHIKSYHQTEELEKKIANPAYHIHNGVVPMINNYDISFSLLLNLASVCNPNNKDILWAFISRYAPSANPQSAPYLDHLAEFAVNYYNDFIKKTKQYLTPDDRQKALLAKIIELLEQTDETATAEEIQNAIYRVGMDANYENLRDFFKEIYQILLGQTEGPRLGSFFKLYGIQDTITLIKEKIGV